MVALGERDCSIQRRHQKVVEIAPAPGLPPTLRERITAAALRLGRAARYDGASARSSSWWTCRRHCGDTPFAFIEANARLQVEHTVTEEVTGLDLVELQLRLAGGATLADLGLDADGAGAGAAGLRHPGPHQPGDAWRPTGAPDRRVAR